MSLKDAAGISGHIASPDVLVDEERKEFRLYYHGPTKQGQQSFVALSPDGLKFRSVSDEPLGTFYFRVFRWHETWYAMAKGGQLYRSPDGLKDFVKGPNPFPGSEKRKNDNAPGARHVALHRVGETLWVYYSNIGDKPERILRRNLQLSKDWTDWTCSAPEEVLRPELQYEGAELPLTASSSGAASGRENALRDPAIFVDEDRRVYLLYSVAGESGIGIAELREAQ
jgi:hypothetical protein